MKERKNKTSTTKTFITDKLSCFFFLLSPTRRKRKKIQKKGVVVSYKEVRYMYTIINVTLVLFY